MAWKLAGRGRNVGLALLVLFVGAQFFGPDREVPPAQTTSIWEEPTLPAAVGEILDRACADCHSYRTRWPWYSRVVPVSWLLAHDVEEGREHLNLSRWGALEDYRCYKLLEEICEEVEKDAMPLPIYRPLHPEAELSDEDVSLLCDWTRSTRARLKQNLDEEAPTSR